MRIYLTAAPEALEACLRRTDQLAHAAFSVDERGTLQLLPLPAALRGGIAVLRAAQPFPVHAADALSRELLRHCMARSFSGIVLELPEAPCPAARLLAQRLEELCRRCGRRLCVPPVCADAAPGAAVMVCTAVSGGSLEQYLRSACDRWGARRIALDLRRLMMEFPLPCPTGTGTPLTGRELAQRRQGRSVYYSDALCARYFTCRQNGQTHFILFDDADTLQRKTALAGSMGIGVGFVAWSEVADIADGFFGKMKEGEP